jgi:hypothetical protein
MDETGLFYRFESLFRFVSFILLLVDYWMQKVVKYSYKTCLVVRLMKELQVNVLCLLCAG